LFATGKGNCIGLSLYLFGKAVRKQMSCSLSDDFFPPASVQAGYIEIYEVNKEQEA
jgi:hypothetical protein